MFKNKLQEFCQKKSWTLPEYETKREGPPHNPRFLTTVTVNSIPFTSPLPSKTVKLSQNDAALVAFNHFSQLNPISPPLLQNLSFFPQPSGSPAHVPDVGSILPTNKVLQPNSEGVCQTPQISSPVATVADVTEAQDRKSNATVADVTEAQDLNSNATVADVTKAQDKMHLYKTQLQNYAQKRNLNLPVYTSEWEGPPHAMRFKCNVEIDGQTFESPKFYSTLKDAEHAAAEVAFLSLSPSAVQEDDIMVYKNLLQEFLQKEGFNLPVYSTNKSGEPHKPTFISQVEVEGEVFTGLESKSKKQAELSAAKVAFTTLKERKGKQVQSFSIPLLAHQGQIPSSNSNVITVSQLDADPKSLVSPGLVTSNQHDKDKLKENSSSSGNTDGCSKDSSSLKFKDIPSFSDSTNVDLEPMSSTASSGQKKVIVYAKKTSVKIEEGGSVMPMSDDKWIAYSHSH